MNNSGPPMPFTVTVQRCFSHRTFAQTSAEITHDAVEEKKSSGEMTTNEGCERIRAHKRSDKNI